MSMPIIKPSKIKRCEAISDVIESVALEQTGISHILNAEGEKIQTALELSETNEDLLEINKSVQSMVNSVTKLEIILQSKLELFNDCLCLECPTKPCKPSTLEFELSSGSIIEGENANTFIFTGTEEETDLLFITNPEVIVIPTSILPAGMSFANNTLTIPCNFDWSKVYTMKFMIGKDKCRYEITIITVAQNCD